MIRRLGMELWRRWKLLRTGPPGTYRLLWNLRLFSRGLWVVLTLLGAYVLFDLLLIQPLSASPRSPHRMPRTIGISTKEPRSEGREPLKPTSEYVEQIGFRNPFTGIPLGQSSSKAAEQKIQETVKDLVIVGIDRGPNPAALIEDKAQGRTVAVTPGDEIRGMKVKKVTTEGVVLIVDGQEVVLQ